MVFGCFSETWPDYGDKNIFWYQSLLWLKQNITQSLSVPFSWVVAGRMKYKALLYINAVTIAN